ncbi:MAG TPA: hypothetical protein VEC16_05270 [Alphaproteobacteria bacterium]|nr:hypothetical protein [Alphaproteobacteria bacterium]
MIDFNQIPMTRLDNIPVTRLSDIPVTILDDIQSQMDPNALVNRVFMKESVERNIPINELIQRRDSQSNLYR